MMGALAGVLAALCIAGCGGDDEAPNGDDPTGGATEGAGAGSGSGGSGSGGAGSGGGGAGGPVGGVITDGNPFADAIFYVDPAYQDKVQSSIDMAPADAALLEKVKGIPTAIWVDKIAALPNIAPNLDAAHAQQQAEGKPVVSVFVVYDLPNRDCAANASNGELSVEADGLNRYKTEYIDAIAAEFAAHPDQRIVAIVEPDSLPNLATNMSIPKCAASEAAYKEGVAYALQKLSMPHVYLYLDTAHSGWLGWPDNQTKIAAIYNEVLAAAGGKDKIRGFATNVANYTVLDEVPEQFDYQFNPCHDEHTYVAQLGQAFAAAGLTGKSFLIDTSRNGRGGIRQAWGNWCNITDSGMGERPRADPRAGIDAYFWVKPPGDSDGTSDPNAPRYDVSCSSVDSATNAPQAGEWFHSFFVEVAKNANPPL